MRTIWNGCSKTERFGGLCRDSDVLRPVGFGPAGGWPYLPGTASKL
ncbi:hypothetical protein DCCM_4280 [Desulfocucumis palustris]|uniref:Uncharacterized protein n=1 Tax=Desulfocucumis palustris TaxID=1898651 RepID=A0A2L2XFP2_9FIRM|nr:hypothetical protein DCCM_4280 [Desulfocucumis palustris]